MGEVIDVGRQRESIHQPSPARLRDDRSRCVVCQDRPHEDGSNFCVVCWAGLAGASVLHRPMVDDDGVSCCCGWADPSTAAATAWASHVRQEMGR